MISVASVWTDQGPYLRLWDVISLILIECAGSAGSVSDPHNPACVHSVASTFSKIWADMLICAGTFARPTGVFGLKLRGRDFSRVQLWDPGGVVEHRLTECGDYSCLIGLPRCMLAFDLRRSWLPYVYLENISIMRTIEWELVPATGVVVPRFTLLRCFMDQTVAAGCCYWEGDDSPPLAGYRWTYCCVRC